MNTYINNLVVTPALMDFISTSRNRICYLIRSFEVLPNANYLSETDKIDTISFLPSSKISSVINNYKDPYGVGIGRTYSKVGRIVSKLFPKDIMDKYVTDLDIENFVNEYKSFFDTKNQKMVVVDGENIRKYYLHKNYMHPQNGSLWKSCMRYPDRQKFLDLYCNNSPKIKMLVLLSVAEDGSEYVRARALLWEDVSDSKGNKLKIMDRIYTVFESDVFVFKKWASKNGYISKTYQNSKTTQHFDVDDSESFLNLQVKIDNHLLSSYPYLDTFQFYNSKSGFFYNHEEKPYEFILIQSNGSLYPTEDEDEVEDFVDDWVDDNDDGW